MLSTSDLSNPSGADDGPLARMTTGRTAASAQSDPRSGALGALEESGFHSAVHSRPLSVRDTLTGPQCRLLSGLGTFER